MWGSGAWGPTWIEGLGCGCPERSHSWGSGLYPQTPAGLPALAPARSLAAPAGPAAAGCCSFTLPRPSLSFTCELGCHLSEASPTSQPTSARRPLIFTTWGRPVRCAHEDVSAGGSGGPRLGGASLGRAASVGAGSEPRPPPRVPQPLGLLVEGPEDHDLLLPGSVLYHAHHALQAGEAGRAPHPGPGQRPVPHVEWERGGARLPRGAAQKTAGCPVSLGRLPSGPGRHPSPRRTGVSRLLSLGGTTRAPQPRRPGRPSRRRACRSITTAAWTVCGRTSSRRSTRSSRPWRT